MIHAVLAAAWRRRYVILLPILVLPPVGFFLGSMAPRSYETRMSVLIQDPAKFNPFLEDLSVKTNLKERMEGLRALLMSRHVLGQVAEDLRMVPPGATEAQQSAAVAKIGGRPFRDPAGAGDGRDALPRPQPGGHGPNARADRHPLHRARARAGRQQHARQLPLP
ncbi:hypothetical protein [Dankookia sp. P2]|uniref:hypothetical protein n=1 Tax=Dankookia sp. P2 TaxID=3423955 RepID=UPI003D6689B1